MKRILLTVASATALMLGGCIIVADGHSGDHDRVRYIGGEINSQLDTDGDARLTGTDVSVSGRADGTVRVTSADFVARGLQAGAVHAAAADISYEGTVAGDVDLRAADIHWRGTVGGRFDAAAADLDFTGSVGERLSASVADAHLSGEFAELDLRAADIRLTRDTVVYGDVKAAAASFHHDGQIAGKLDLSARTAVLNGDIEGYAKLSVDPGRLPWGRDDGLVEINGSMASGEICARRVVITGEVTGPLRVMADETPQINAGSAAEIEFTPRNGERCDHGWEG